LPTGDLDLFAIFTPVSGEVDGAGSTCNQGKEIFAVTNLTTGGSRKLHGWRSDGSIIEHFPKDLSPLMSVQSGVFINDEMSVPLIVDLDNNHKTGIIASIEGLMFSYELGTGCTRTNVDWPESGRSMRKDSSYKTAGRYWKSFTLQGQPGTNIDTAEELLDQLYSRGLKPIEIDRFLNGGWDAHPVNLPFNNFSLTPSSGYLISFDEYPEAKIGPLTRSFVTSVTSLNYSLSPGYTMIGIPTNLLSNININGAVAEDLCNYIYTQSNQIVSDIGYWDSSAADWNWHICGGLVNNFTLDGETPLMLKANAYFNFSIPFTRTRSAQNKVNPIQKKSSSKSTEKPKVPSLPR
jgi:hypothetical protein